MKQIAFVILLFVIANNLIAQDRLSGLMDDFRYKKMTEGPLSRNKLETSDIQGTPYLDEKFIPGKIITPEGEFYDNIPLRYNGFTDDLEFQKGEDAFNIYPKTIVKRAEFGGFIFCCLKYDADGKAKNGLFEILTEGKATLLVKYKVRLLEKEEAKAYSPPKPARFKDPTKEYYLTFDGLTAQLILNKKSMLELFGNQKVEMEFYISKNKLSIRDDDELSKIVMHFNSLK